MKDASTDKLVEIVRIHKDGYEKEAPEEAYRELNRRNINPDTYQLKPKEAKTYKIVEADPELMKQALEMIIKYKAPSIVLSVVLFLFYILFGK